MWRRLESIQVRLHKIKLWAVIATDFISITVEHTIVTWVILTVFLASRHQDRVECCNTSAITVTKEHIVFDKATKEVWLIESFRVQMRHKREITTTGVWYVQGLIVGVGAVARDVQGTQLAILCDHEPIVSGVYLISGGESLHERKSQELSLHS